MSDRVHNGKIHIFGDNINTDIIISGKYLRTADAKVFGDHVFEVLKGEGYSKEVEDGDVIVAGNNFGCGSSREQAALAIKYAGFKMIFAKSFGRIFYRNIINQGILAVEISEDCDCEKLFQQIHDKDEITVNLNESVAYIGKERISFKFKKTSDFLLKIVDAGGLLNYARKDSSNTR